MLLGAAGLAVLAVLLAWPVPRLLAAARWPHRVPLAALMLWQAVGLAGGLAGIGAGLLVAVAPLGSSLPQGVARLAHDLADGVPGTRLQPASWVALAVSVALALRLLSVLVSQTLRTLRLRHRHRTVVDLVSDPWPPMASARVLDHPGQLAYCLPGRRPRVVLSQGTVDRLTGDRLSAVLAHEAAHLRQRHDLVVLPFVALRSTFPFLHGVRLAQASVAELVEMMADDVAVRRCGRQPLAGALRDLGGATSPAAGLLPGEAVAVDRRLRRLDAARTVPVGLSAAVAVAAVALVGLPTLALVLPALIG